MAARKYINPFYVVLVLAGVVFCVTAFAYGVMTVKSLRPTVAELTGPRHPLLVWLDEYGFQAMMIEVGIIAVATFAAMGTDEFWARGTRTDGLRTGARRTGGEESQSLPAEDANQP